MLRLPTLPPCTPPSLSSQMARHGMRSLFMWLVALPVVLAGSVPPTLMVLWVASTSYIFLGIDELGSQVSTVPPHTRRQVSRPRLLGITPQSKGSQSPIPLTLPPRPLLHSDPNTRALGT